MLSKKNIQGRLRKVEPTQQRFSIRKFTVGAASVLIGMTFMGMANTQNVHAATTKPEVETAAKKNVDPTIANALNAAKIEADKSAATEESAKTKEASSNPAATEKENASTNIKSSENENNVVKANTTPDATKGQESASKASQEVAETKTPENQMGGVAGKSIAKTDSQATEKKSVAPTGEEAKKLANKYDKKAASTATQSQDAGTWEQLANALNDANVGTINLTGDITVNNDTNSAIKKPNPLVAKNKLQLTSDNISRAVTVNGNGNTLDFGDNYLTFSNGNGSKNNPWNVTFKDITINSNVETPVDFDGTKGNNDTVTYNNATIEIKNGALINSDKVDVVFEGNNTITTDDVGAGATITANTVKVVSGTTTINNATSKGKIGSADAVGRNTIWVDPQDGDADSLNIAEGATLTINAKSPDLRGIVTDDFLTGNITVNGTLNENMENGHSSAIVAGNLNIGTNGSVNINTKQDNLWSNANRSYSNGVANYSGNHYGVISLGVGKMGGLKNADSNTLNDNGSLTIVRANVPKDNDGKGTVMAPLISFGSGSAGVLKGTFAINVGEGATFDLQDSSDFINTAYSGNYPNTPEIGMITMFGSGAATSNTINFTKPAYVNLQRKGSQTGTLLRLEGSKVNTIQLNGVTPGGTPLSQWDEGNYTDNPSDTWRITTFTGHSASSNDAIKGFESLDNKGMSRTVLGSNSQVTMTMDKKGNVVYRRNSDGTVVNDPNGTTTEEVELNNFLNNFNFWTPQRISFGSKAIIKKPAYNPTTVKQGDKATVDPAYPITAPETATDDQMKVTYKAADDTPAWVTVDENTGTLTLAPTADNSKVGMYNVPVVVTNTDETDSGKGSTNTVFAPVYVTDGNEQVNWGKDKDGNYTGAVVVTTDPSALKAHETTDNSSVLNAADAVKSIQEYQMDTDTTVDTTPTNIAKTADGISISWAEDDPSTVVPTATASEKIPATVNVKFNTNSQPFTDKVLGQDTDTPEAYTSTSDMEIPAAGATAKDVEAPVDVKAGEKLSEDQFKALVNNNVPAEQVASYAWQTAPVKGKDATIRITFKDNDANGQPTYLDVNIPAKNLNIETNDADTYQPSYKPADVKQGGSVTTDAPSYTTSTKNGVTINPDGKAPEGTTYSISTDTTLPEGVTAKVDPDTGKVTITTTDQTPEGPIEIPVKVTYKDGSSETVNAPIIVGGTTFIGTDYTVTVYADLNNLHETSDKSMYPDPKSVITKVVYWNNKDLAAGKNLEGTSADLNSGVTFEWTKAPNTVVESATMSADLPGSGTSTVSAENPALKISFANGSQLVQKIGNYLNLNDDYGWSQTLHWYGEPVIMQGAAPVEDAASKKLEVTPAKAGDALTAAEKALINTTNLDKLTANKPVSYTWAKDLKDGDTQGTVKITFSDKDKGGQPTYLNVELPAGSLDVKDNGQQGQQDTQSTITINYVNKADNKTIKSTPVTGKVGANTGITKESINKGVPENWQVVGGQTLNVPTTFGSKDSSLTVYVEHKTENVPVDKSNKDTYREVTQTIVSVDPTTGEKKTLKTTSVPFQRTGVKDMVTGDITWNAWEGPEGSKTVDGKSTYEIPEFTVPTKTGYDSYVNGTKETEIPAVSVNADSQNITDTITYAKKGTETKVIQPTNPTDPKQANLFKKVTRTINIPTPNADGKTTDNSVTQTITFGRTKTVNAKTGALIGYSPYTVYNTKTNALTNDKTGTFPEKDIPQVDGYASNVDGKPATKVQEVEDVTPETENSTVNVTYTKNGEQGHTDTDADKYSPEGTTISVDEGHKLDNNDAADGIKNKNDMPEGTTYSWDPANTPSTDTPGNKAGTVIVTYPDNSTDSVPVIVHVNSQAESNDPQGQDVHTTVGGDPQPVEGIKNADDMPKGTTYTWTNKPDTSKPGTVSTVVNVIYPDHSVDQVPVKVIITDDNGNTKPNNKNTDADSNDPQGQTVNTVIGTVPPAEDGIKNKSDLPEGTKYEWSGTPDVYTKGSHPGVVKVTYPDNSVDYVPVTVNVTNEPTGKPTTIPEGGDVPKAPTVIDWTNGGKVPDGKEPEGTTITWDKQPDPSKPGDQQGTVKITYPDGQTTTVVVPVTVTPKTPSADDDFNPTANPLNLPYGAKVPAAEDQINPDSLNGYTIKSATWTVEPDTSKPGLQLAHISVTGTKDGKEVTKDVPVYVHVGTEAEAYAPEGQNITTTIGVLPDASEGIKNKADMPEGTTYTWSLAPDVSTTGVKPSLIKVTYSDGSVAYVPVDVTVTDNSNNGNGGENVTPTPNPTPNPVVDPTPVPQDIHTPKGVVPDPEDGIKNKDEMPEGTTYTWKDTPDVNTEGDHPAVIIVTYPDGKKTEVPVTVVVDKDKTGDKNKDTKPEPKPITTNKGKLPDPSDGIKNKDEMPEGTKYTWKDTPDINTEGTHKVTIVVTYPDGKTAEVTTTITVVKAGAAIGGTMINGNGGNGTSANNNAGEGNGTVKAANNGQEGQLPQTGASDSSKAGIFGLALAAIAGFFGIAGDRKRKNN